MSVQNQRSRIGRIAVLVSVGRHPVSAVARYSRNDAVALGVALKLAQSVSCASVDIFHAGNPESAALADYLALGASSIRVLAMEPDQEIIPALVPVLKNYDLILCGCRAEGGHQTGLVPYLLASQLGLTLVADITEIAPDQDGDGIVLRQFLPKGRRRAITIRLPALLTIHPLAPSRMCYAYAGLRDGTIDAQHASTGLVGSDQTQAWNVTATQARPLKLVAQEKRSGHARMLSATVAESRGGRMITEGNANEKAQAILAYLREHRLVDY